MEREESFKQVIPELSNSLLLKSSEQKEKLIQMMSSNHQIMDKF
jgi:hypothetical protein